MDKENCHVNGYDFSSVFSHNINGDCLLFIGFNHKRAFDYMKRKHDALFNLSYNNKVR